MKGTPCTVRGTENSQQVFPDSRPVDPKGAHVGEVCAAAQGQPTVSWASGHLVHLRSRCWPRPPPLPSRGAQQGGFLGTRRSCGPGNRLTREL